jgi:phosphate-selective porin OprO and OprP
MMSSDAFVRSLIGASIFSGALLSPMVAAANPEFTVRGRLHLDYALHDEDSVTLDDGFLFRRTRIGVQGTINEHWSGIIEYDFAENGTNAQDIILRRKLGGGTLKFGNFKVPMGLEEVSNTNDLAFVERSSANTALVDARRIGVGYDYYAGALGFQGMVYGRALGADQPGDDPLGLAGRFIYAPRVDGHLVHLAASVAYEDAKDFNTRRFRDRPEARVDGKRLIDTGNIAGVDSTTKFGFELAFQSGPFIAQAEYFDVSVERSDAPQPSFNGWYVQGSWIVTGERRGYRDGIFRGLAPGSPERGAWELSARFSTVDLNDAGIAGGTQDAVTLGVNYYPNANVRFMLNYIVVDVEDSGAIVNGMPVGDDAPRILIGRVQYHF